MHWLPFLVSEYFNFDARYVAFFIWAVGASLLMFRGLKTNSSALKLATPFMFLVTFMLMANNVNTIIGATIELLIIGYYLMFVVSLNEENYLYSGIIFSACLLSRYYIILWLPLWFFVMFLNNKKYLFKTLVIVAIMTLILYVIPFVLKNTEILSTLLYGYDIAFLTEWQKNMNPNTNTPAHLYVGNGFAYLFYEKYRNTNVKEGFQALKNALLLITVSATFLLGIIFWFIRKKIDFRIFLMGSFKIYLTFFLGFITVPYSYLMAGSVFIAIAIFSEQARYNVDLET